MENENQKTFHETIEDELHEEQLEEFSSLEIEELRKIERELKTFSKVEAEK